MKGLRQVARYFAGTLDWELTSVTSHKHRITTDAYTDSEWAGDLD